MSDFAGKHVIITGASTGIGRAAAIMLAGRGAKVSLIARSQGNLDDVVAEIGSAAKAVPADVADRGALAEAIQQATAEHGPPDGLFANAGNGGSFQPFTSFADENWDSLIATNLTGVFAAIRAVLPGMIERRSGSIVVTGSLASKRGMPMNAGYVASKHGVLGLSRAAAVEAAPHNVRVNCLIPGFIDTPLLANIPGNAKDRLSAMVPQRRIGSADEAAAAAVFLLSDAASHITAQSIAVDGGLLGTLSPA